jgi:hypothetical protein
LPDDQPVREREQRPVRRLSVAVCTFRGVKLSSNLTASVWKILTAKVDFIIVVERPTHCRVIDQKMRVHD